MSFWPFPAVKTEKDLDLGAVSGDEAQFKAHYKLLQEIGRSEVFFFGDGFLVPLFLFPLFFVQDDARRTEEGDVHTSVQDCDGFFFSQYIPSLLCDSGAFSHVFLVENLKKKSQYAAKIVDKKKLKGKVEILENEIRILRM